MGCEYSLDQQRHRPQRIPSASELLSPTRPQPCRLSLPVPGKPSSTS